VAIEVVYIFVKLVHISIGEFIFFSSAFLGYYPIAGIGFFFMLVVEIEELLLKHLIGERINII